MAQTVTKIRGPRYIKMPSAESEVVKLIKTFYQNFGFPQCLDARLYNQSRYIIKQPDENEDGRITHLHEAA